MHLTQTEETKKIWHFGVIGLGGISELHIEAIKGIEEARLTMVSDRKITKAREVGQREQCAWTTDYTEMLSNPDLDVVCVTTSSGSHAPIGVEVIKAGKHLLIEKPMAMTTAEAEQMLRLAKANGVMISVVSQRRFEPQHMIVHDVIKQGRIGKLLLIEIACPFFRSQDYYDSADWRGTVDQDGGVLMNQGIHSIDLMLWLGGRIQTVYGKTATQTHRMEAEDIGLALLKFADGAFGTIMFSTSMRPGFPPIMNIYGEKGTIKIEGTTIVHWTVPDVPKPEAQEPSTLGGGVSDPREISNVLHKMQIAEMIAALKDGQSPKVDGRDGWRAVRLVQAIYRSAEEGKEVSLTDDL
jgi:UDP-N-acetyl-2-amino-2-deoxyglucuronate dehydrogenase